MDKSVEGGLKSIPNAMTVRKNPQENREKLQKFPLNLNPILPAPMKNIKYHVGRSVSSSYVRYITFVSVCFYN